ncbi:MAG: HAD family hydrolase [bacterium]
MNKKRSAVFVDRDGTLIRDVNYLTDPKNIRVYKNTYKSLSMLKKAGYVIIMTTNQSAIDRKYLSIARLHQIHNKLLKIFKDHNAYIDAVYYCPHLPEQKCSCRKPNIGMIKKAGKKFNIDLSSSYAVGDKSADVHMAWNFGGKGILVLTGKGRRERAVCSPKKLYHVASTFYNAVKKILIDTSNMASANVKIC